MDWLFQVIGTSVNHLVNFYQNKKLMPAGIIIRIAFNLCINLGCKDILIIVNLAFHKCDIFLLLLRFPLISFNSLLFSLKRSCTPFVKLNQEI